MFNSHRYTANRNAAIWNKRFAGKEAFTACYSNGYKHGAIFGELHRAHRIIWMMVNGRDPKVHIDHINGDKADNRIANLREATTSENKFNIGLRSDNMSGFKGVSWIRRRSNWQSEIAASGKRRNLGYFSTAEEAARAYDAAAKEMHGHFAWLNFPDQK